MASTPKNLVFTSVNLPPFHIPVFATNRKSQSQWKTKGKKAAVQRRVAAVDISAASVVSPAPVKCEAGGLPAHLACIIVISGDLRQAL